MNRADRLRKVAPGAADETLAVLAALPAVQFGEVVKVIRQGKRDALKAEAELPPQLRRKLSPARRHPRSRLNDLPG